MQYDLVQAGLQRVGGGRQAVQAVGGRARAAAAHAARPAPARALARVQARRRRARHWGGTK